MCKEMPKKGPALAAATLPRLRSDEFALMADKVVHGPAAAALLARTTA
jgi:hypothetical protein